MYDDDDNDEDDERIVQIIPAAGWRACYKDGMGKLFTSPLVAWGLTAGGDVIALDADIRGDVERVTADNLVEILGPGQEPSAERTKP